MFLFLLFQNIHTATVIIKYSVIHTGANIQSGGLNTGLFSNEYHGSLKLIVAKLPKKDAKNVIKKNKEKDKNLFFNIIIIYNNMYE